MTTNSAIINCPGYEAVQDLLPDGSFRRCTDIWRLKLEYYRDEAEELKQRMVLELTHDRLDRSADRVALIMESPAEICFPDDTQILGLDVEDIRERGLEKFCWRVYDYEMGGFELYCVSIRFERRKNTEQD